MIYAIYNGEHIKIGFSNNPKRRLKQLSTGSSLRLRLLTTFQGDKTLEKQIHQKHQKVRHNGEWFIVTQELLDYLNMMSSDKWIQIDEDGVVRSYRRM
jgi:hypothetical protein